MFIIYFSIWQWIIINKKDKRLLRFLFKFDKKDILTSSYLSSLRSKDILAKNAKYFKDIQKSKLPYLISLIKGGN